MHNILVVNVNWLGDVVFTAPIFKALKDAFPQSKVCCLAVPRVKEILECIEGVDEVIVYDEDGRHKSILGKIALIFALRRMEFETVFILHRSLTRALLVYFAGIKNRIGYDTKGRKSYLTQALSEPKQKIHRSDYYLKVVEDFGVEIINRKCILRVDPIAESKVKSLMTEEGLIDGNFIVMHPGGNWELKRWPVGNYVLLIQKLMENGKEKIVIAGSSEDLQLVEEIVEHLPIKPVILTGKISLKELMVLMHRAKSIISADSGPIHLASGVGTRVIGLFGPTRPEITGPRGSGDTVILQKDVGCNREACYHLKCPSNLCMQALSVEEVLHAIG